MKVEVEISDLLHNKSDKLCRVCLTEAGEKSTCLFGIHDSPAFSEKLMLCTRIRVRNNDGLPSNICEKCSGELDAADKFRIKCENSDLLLRKFLEENVGISGGIAPLESTPIPVSDIKDEYGLLENKFLGPDDKEDSVTRGGNVDCEVPELTSLDCVDDSNFSFSDNELISTIIKRHSKKRKKASKLKRKKLRSPIEAAASENLFDDLNLSECVASLATTVKTEPYDNICHVCGKSFKSKKHLSKHIETCQDKRGGTAPRRGAGRRYECSECAYSSPRRQTLLYHMRIHTGEKPYRCDECDRRFAQPSSLSSHMKSHSDKMYFTCPECGKQFKHKEKYERHKSVHSDEKNFVCPLCNKGLKSPDTLKSHMNRHYNIRNFSCETCGSAFVTRIELLNHAKKHSDEKKFQCTICDFRTRLKQILEKHMKRHTGERSLKCESCTYTCYDRGELKFHMRKHTRERKYSCPVCQRLFIHSSSVNKHMFRIHGLHYKVNDNVDRRIIK